MSRYPAAMKNVTSDQAFQAAEAPGEHARHSGEYFALARLLFHKPAAVAVIGSDPGNDSPAETTPHVAEGLAQELGALGKRVVVVSVNTLLSIDAARLDVTRISEDTEFIPGAAPHVWHWPASPGSTSDLFPFAESPNHSPRSSGAPANWLDFLRRSFDAVLLDCPYVEGAPGVIEVAAMADAVVLAVQAGYTSKAQVQHNLQALQLWGARVVGSILIERS